MPVGARTQVTHSDIASAGQQEGTTNPTQLAQIHSNNVEYQKQKQDAAQAFQQQQSELNAQLAAAPAGSPEKEQLVTQIQQSQNNYASQQAAQQAQACPEPA